MLLSNELRAFDVRDDRSVGTATDGVSSLEGTPSSSPRVGNFSDPSETLKLIQKLCGRYKGPLSPKPTEDTLSQQMEFVTRDGRVVKINIADQRAKLGL